MNILSFLYRFTCRVPLPNYVLGEWQFIGYPPLFFSPSAVVIYSTDTDSLIYYE